MHVNGCCSDSVILEGQSQGCLVHETPSGGVDKEGAWPHLFDGVLVNKMVVVLIEGAVERHAVRLEQQVLQADTNFSLSSELLY